MKKKKKSRTWIVALAAVVLAVGIVAVITVPSGDDHLDDMVSSASKTEIVRKADRPRKANASTRHSMPRPKPILAVNDAERTPEERALEERIEKSLDDEDLDAALACVDEALRCEVAEIRQNMVDALGWFGEKALPELTPFLADADDDIRSSAMSEWTMALSSIEDEVVKVRTVELAMGVLRDEDALEDISGEYIGVDERLAVESLVRIIDGGGTKEGIEKAKETYEFVTGDEWAGVDEAERWIAEEYEPPESE